MENRSYAIAAGLFVLLLGAAVVAGGFWFSRDTAQYERFTLHTRGTVSGLNIQATVRLRGVEVGKVEAIRFDEADPRVILVDIGVRGGTPLTAGTYAQLAAQGVTGLSFVQLADDGSNPARRDSADPEQARIPLRPSFFDQVSIAGQQLIVEAESAAKQISALLKEDNQVQILQTLKEVGRAANGIVATVEGLQPGVRAVPGLARGASETMKRADDLMIELKQLAATLNTRLDALERVARSAEQVSAEVGNLGATGRELSDTVSASTLPRLNALIDEVARNSRSLERLIGEISEQPASLVFGRPGPAPGPGEPGYSAGGGR